MSMNARCNHVSEKPDTLADYDKVTAQTLSQTLETWLEELQQALGMQAQGDAVDA